MGGEIRLIENFQIETVDTSALRKRYLLTTDTGRQFELSQMMADTIITLQLERTLDRTAKKLSEFWGKEISPEQLEVVVENFLKKMGLVDLEADSDEASEQAEPPERKQPFDQVHFRVTILPASVLKPISKVTRYLYHRNVALILIAAIAFVHYVVLRNFDKAMLGEVIFNSSVQSYLTVYELLYSCVLWHELGHVSALARFGKDAKEIGFGLYFIFPVMYTDVSNCWALKRWQRVIVDCGGVYFQAMTAIPLYLTHLLTGSPIPVFMILVNFSLILLILNPILKFDGYWVLADALGIINLREKSLALVSHYYRRLILRQPLELTERLQFPRTIRLCGLVYGMCSGTLLWLWLLWLILYSPKVISNYAVIVTRSSRTMAEMLSELELIRPAGILLRLLLQTIPVFALVMMLYQVNRRVIQFVVARFNKE
jgi:putative peptide zinc metalloprotease protein